MSPEGDTIPFCKKRLIFYKSKGVIVLFEDILYAPKTIRSKKQWLLLPKGEGICSLLSLFLRILHTAPQKIFLTFSSMTLS